MLLTRLVYTSTVTNYFRPEDIENILLKARKHNESADITGVLSFHRRYFLQCLEGSRENINETYHRILNDKRHSRITILSYEQINVREFSDWSMAYIPESSLTKPVNLSYSGSSEFNPYDMSGESACQMLVSLKKLLPFI